MPSCTDAALSGVDSLKQILQAGRLYESVSSSNEVLTDGRDGDGAVELPEVDALAERDVTNDMLSLIGGLCGKS